MGRSFGFSDAWAKQARASEMGTVLQQSGDEPQFENAPLKNPQTGEVVTTRERHQVGTESGLWDDEVRAGANRLNKTGVERDYDRGTLVEEYTERDGNTGEIIGTREVTWERTGSDNRTMVLAKSRFRAGGNRRYFTF